MGTLIGFDPHTLDGIFCPGGSYSNMMAIFTALQKARRLAKSIGVGDQQRYVVIASEHAHYSIKSTVSLLGLADQAPFQHGPPDRSSSSEQGSDPSPEQLNEWSQGFATVLCDEQGRMIPSELVRIFDALEMAGFNPFIICLTAGTTVLGGYDPFAAIADIRDSLSHRRMGAPWIHIDGAWGASVIMSDTHRCLMEGAARADSLVWNPHKMMHVPLQCSVLLVSEKGCLEANLHHFSAASYLFHSSDPSSDTHPLQCDIGLKTLQCGRRADALKLWLMWKFHGRLGFARHIDKSFELAHYFHQQIKLHPHFLPVSPQPSQCLNVCFWYIPPDVRQKYGPWPVQSVTDLLPKFHHELENATKLIQAGLRSRGIALTDISPLPGRPYFLRFIINNSKASYQDILSLLSIVESFFTK